MNTFTTRKNIFNIIYSFLLNIFSITLLLLTNFMLPILLQNNLDVFGFFQLYLLFVSFSGFFHFGILDGALIVYTSKTYKNSLQKFYFPIISSLTLIEILVSSFLIFFSLFIKSDTFRLIFQFSIINLLILIPKAALLTYFQILKRLEIFYMFELIQKLSFLIGFFLFFYINPNNLGFIELIFLDLISKFIPLAILFITQLKLILKYSFIKTNFFILILESFKVGFPIMINSIIGLSTISIIKFIFASFFSIDLFSNLTILFSFSNLIFLLLNFFYLYFVPILRGNSNLEPKKVYFLLKNGFSIFLLFFFFLYDFFVIVINYFFSESFIFIDYLYFIFPYILFGVIYNIATSVYIAVTMSQKKSLLINLIVFLFEIILLVIGIFFTTKLEYFLFISVFSIFLKVVLSEIFLSPELAKYNLQESIALFFVFIFFLLYHLQYLSYIYFLFFLFIYFIFVFIGKKWLIKFQ